jgi:hypothetical protein
MCSPVGVNKRVKVQNWGAKFTPKDQTSRQGVNSGLGKFATTTKTDHYNSIITIQLLQFNYYNSIITIQ